MAQSRPTLLLTTRTRAGVGAALSAYVLVLTIRDLLQPAHAEPGWLITPERWLPIWLTVVLNLVFYSVFCWVGLSWTRSARGGERLFIAAWSAGVLLSPLKSLGPQWSLTIHYVCDFGLAVALLVAMSLVLRRANVTAPQS